MRKVGRNVRVGKPREYSAGTQVALRLDRAVLGMAEDLAVRFEKELQAEDRHWEARKMNRSEILRRAIVLGMALLSGKGIDATVGAGGRKVRAR